LEGQRQGVVPENVLIDDVAVGVDNLKSRHILLFLPEKFT
jgi:hypothetical protein